MIQGLKLDIKTEELVALLNRRITHHEQTARECDRQLAADATDISAARVEAADEATARDDHLEQAAFLTLLRDHLVPGEMYRLAEEDLRLADVVPIGLS